MLTRNPHSKLLSPHQLTLTAHLHAFGAHLRDSISILAVYTNMALHSPVERDALVPG